MLTRATIDADYYRELSGLMRSCGIARLKLGGMHGLEIELWPTMPPPRAERVVDITRSDADELPTRRA